MINSIQFSEKSLNLLSLRQLNNDEIQQFSNILNQAKDSQGSAKDRLLAMSASELALVQKANSLAAPINVSSLSEEGAINLLSQPDHSDKVDLNNDGIVEVGAANNLIFPPVNAPAFVKTAWESATADMSESDKMMLELRMHIAVFGVKIEGVQPKQALNPEQQWSQQGIDALFTDLRSNLEFRVNLEGWTDHNLMLKGFYEDFESALNETSAFVMPNAQTVANTANNITEEKQPTVDETDSNYSNMMQLLLDARMGIDREKLQEIEEKIQNIENNPDLSGKQKKQLIKALQQQKEVIFEEAQRRTVENEKRKSLLPNNVNLLERLEEQQLKEVG
ncbi:hypothetical protein [uncultured Paraglaciecola sp.]|uniref:hypothetical protein n=1 Tax=uncultured Paraglaciecola sp. TaxID=1765024 RepID=UPI0030D9A720|tara:strand:+ start:340 stop:1344 length:1005 start_codon:yes stop_codon:yes gene_type:complete